MNYSMGDVIGSNCFSAISRPIPKYPGTERFQNYLAKQSCADNRCGNNAAYGLESVSAHQYCSDEFFGKSSLSSSLQSRLPYKVTGNMLKSKDSCNTSCDCASEIDSSFPRGAGGSSKGTGHTYRRKKLQTDVAFHRATAKSNGVPTAYFECGSAGKKCFRCPECYYVTDRKNNLKRHLSTMHQDCGKMLQCCEKMFNSKAALREHIFLLHRSGYRCSYCSRSFCRKALLKRHIAVHEDGKSKPQREGDICCYYDQSNLRFRKHTKFPIVHSGVSLKSESITQNYYEPFVKEELTVDVCQLESDFNDDPAAFPTKRFNSSSRMIFYNRIRSTHYDEEKDSAADRLPHNQKECENTAQPNIKKTIEYNRSRFHSSDNRYKGCEDTFESLYHFSVMQSKELSPAALNVAPPRRVMKTSDVKRLCTNPYLCTKCGQDFTHQQQIIQHGRFCERPQHLIGQTLPSV